MIIKFISHLFPQAIKINCAIIFLCIINCSYCQIHAYINLSDTSDDHFHIKLNINNNAHDTLHYFFPKIVPGYYTEVNLGKFVSNFLVRYKNGNEVELQKNSVNSYIIPDAKNIDYLSYMVEDTFDSNNPIYEGVGSNIIHNKVYLINLSTIIGFFDETPNYSYNVNFLHKKHLYASTSLVDTDPSPNSDKFSSKNYRDLVDSPIMYNVPDTTTIEINNLKILISVQSQNKQLNSNFFAKNIAPLLNSQVQFMNEILNVPKYTFIVYLNPKEYKSGIRGAMEHSQSSLYTLIEQDSSSMSKRFATIASHEFLHLITPLNLHSEEIHYFNFNEPNTSEHLWLYEGVIEYLSHLTQVRYGLIDKIDFFDRISEKIVLSKMNFNDTIPLTQVSKLCFGKYNKEWPNIYMKGALIAMCLDLKLLSLSEGRYGLIDLIKALCEKYGKNHPFKDNSLFSDIIDLSYPQLKSFFQDYIQGNKVVPYEHYLQLAGVNLIKEKKVLEYSLGNPKLNWDKNINRFYVSEISNLDEIGEEIGYKEGDIFLSLNNNSIESQPFGNYTEKLFSKLEEGDPLKIELERWEDKGYRKLVFNIPAKKTLQTKHNVIELDKNPTDNQLKIRKSWLNQ